MNTGFEASIVLELDPPNPVNDDMGALPKRGCGLGASTCTGDEALGGSGVAAGGSAESAGLEGAPKVNGDAADSAGLGNDPPNKDVAGDTSLGGIWMSLNTPPNVEDAGAWDPPKRDDGDVAFGDPPNDEGLISSTAFSFFSPSQRGFSTSLIGVG